MRNYEIDKFAANTAKEIVVAMASTFNFPADAESGKAVSDVGRFSFATLSIKFTSESITFAACSPFIIPPPYAGCSAFSNW